MKTTSGSETRRSLALRTYASLWASVGMLSETETKQSMSVAEKCEWHVWRYRALLIIHLGIGLTGQWTLFRTSSGYCKPPIYGAAEHTSWHVSYRNSSFSNCRSSPSACPSLLRPSFRAAFIAGAMGSPPFWVLVTSWTWVNRVNKGMEKVTNIVKHKTRKATKN